MDPRSLSNHNLHLFNASRWLQQVFPRSLLVLLLCNLSDFTIFLPFKSSSARLDSFHHQYTLNPTAATFTSRATGDGEVGELRTCASAARTDILQLLTQLELLALRVLQMNRLASSVSKDDPECVGGMRSEYRESSNIRTSKSNKIPRSSQAIQLSTWLEWLAAKEAVGPKQNQGLWVLISTMSTRALRPCSPTQSLQSARSTLISQPRTRQPNYTLTGGGYSSRFGQESRYDVCTPTVHAQNSHEFCRDPITSPPLSGQASKRRSQWHLGKIHVAEDDVQISPLFPKPLPLFPRPNTHRRSRHHQVGTVGEGAHTREPFVALEIHARSLTNVAPPAWVPRYST
ncbi:hypothetical protein BKA70DRAFT_1220796 [Coprinopsis sp. MPI-PUGE-AT-0042]|nr:hypothetical protein BKA70DRAFT_1220796 [Coprinopsis sp. MPI-PUGE-AT-0042]